MGFLSRAVSTKASDPLALWAEILRAQVKSKAGTSVNLDTAMKVAALFACLRVISQGVAQVPFKLYRETTVNGLRNIEPARGHRLYDVLARQPNDFSTSFEFRETLAIHAALGDAFAFKNVVGTGSNRRIAELILLPPGRMRVLQAADWTVTYEFTAESGAKQIFPAEAIWHVRGPSWSGFAGIQILQVAREALGLSIATEETHSKLHAKGVRPSGVYSVDGTLDEAKYKALKKWIEAEVGGSENAGGVMVLDRAAKFMSTAMTGLDAQHLETRKYQIEEVCRFMGVSPIMAFYSDKATTYASAEQMFLSHVVHCLAPWYARIEQSADVHLLSKADREQGYYTHFISAGLLRGAAKDRADAHAKALGSGGHQPWMTVDEVRALEELNPMGGPAATLQAPSNSQQPPPQGAQ